MLKVQLQSQRLRLTDVFLWFLLVHIPRMLIDPAGPVGWSEMAESLAFSMMALLLATRR